MDEKNGITILLKILLFVVLGIIGLVVLGFIALYMICMSMGN